MKVQRGNPAPPEQPADEPGEASPEKRSKRRPRTWPRGLLRHFLVVLFVCLWIGAVVYPDPRPLVTSIGRLGNPPVDGPAVAGIAATLPDDYKVIEDYSLDYVKYTPAWTVYGLPWYFPSIQEVVRDHAGDCQARALLAASIYQAKGMPYTLRYSFDHVWVDYPGKQAPDMEDPATSFVADDGGGWLTKLPTRIPLWSIIKVRVAYHWTPMPLLQKIMILIGSAIIFGWGERRWLRRLLSVFRWPMRKKAIA
jgi:hypothetical protein